MTPEQFVYWLQGYAEIKGGWEEPTAEEWKRIKDHLELVFKKETPKYGAPVGPGISPTIPTYLSVPVDRQIPYNPFSPQHTVLTC